jgi:hypothetical protein
MPTFYLDGLLASGSRQGGRLRRDAFQPLHLVAGLGKPCPEGKFFRDLCQPGVNISRFAVINIITEMLLLLTSWVKKVG